MKAILFSAYISISLDKLASEFAKIDSRSGSRFVASSRQMIIKKTAFSVGFWSDDYKLLAKWYQDILKLKPSLSASLPDDSFIAFKFGEGYFWIGKHDKVKGKNKDPYRIMIEFYTESIFEAFEELKNKKVAFIAEPFPDPLGGEGWCMTFKDPDGNIVQMYGNK